MRFLPTRCRWLSLFSSCFFYIGVRGLTPLTTFYFGRLLNRCGGRLWGAPATQPTVVFTAIFLTAASIPSVAALSGTSLCFQLSIGFFTVLSSLDLVGVRSTAVRLPRLLVCWLPIPYGVVKNHILKTRSYFYALSK